MKGDKPASRVAYGTHSSQREKSTHATRAKILRTALQLFSRQGYAHTGIAAIAEAAGVSRPTFYQHFASKSAVLMALTAEFEVGIVALYRDLAAIHPPTLDRLVDWVARFLAYCQSDQKTVLLVLSTFPIETDMAQDRADLFERLLTIAGAGHPAFARATAGGDGATRGRAILLLGQIEALPRLVMTATPLCEASDLIQALAENLLRFLHDGADSAG